MTAVAFVANTNLLLLSGLKDEAADTYINDAIVTVTVNDHAGVPVVGDSWPLPMAYIATSNGDYSVALTHTLSFLNKKKYTAVIDADGGASPELWGHWEFPFEADTRTGV